MQRIIIDVREPFEYQADHVEGALNIPPVELMTGAKKLEGTPKDAEIILYCKTGSRSNAAMHILTELGYTNLTNGISAGQVRSKYLK